MHEKYVVDISAGKASKARENAQKVVDGLERMLKKLLIGPTLHSLTNSGSTVMS